MTQSQAYLPTAGTPEGALNCVIELMQNLTTIYQSELDAIAAQDIPAFLSLQPRKEQISRDYELKVKEIQIRAESIKATDPALRAKVLSAQNEMAEIAEQSKTACLNMAESIKRVRNRLIEAARRALAEEQMNTGNYGSDGRSGTNPARPVATALNEAV